MSIGIKDVAARAGVSTKTVSRVMNEEPHVREEVRDAVKLAVKELRYRPNVFARSLSSSRSYLIALLIEDPAWSNYIAELQRGAQVRCRDRDYHLVVEPIHTRWPQWEERLRSTASSLRVEGVIISPPLSRHGRLLELLDELNVPIVRIAAGDHVHPSEAVEIEEEAAAFAMTAHLIDLGHRAIGFVAGVETDSATVERKAGYVAAMLQHGLEIDPSWLAGGDFKFGSGVQAAAAFLAADRRPTAIFASNDDMALGVQSALVTAGLRVPEEISVVGFDDAPSASLGLPPITTMRQPIAALASVAVDLLVDQIGAHGRPPVRTSRKLPCELIMRSSSAVPPAYIPSPPKRLRD